jgi:integrase
MPLKLVRSRKDEDGPWYVRGTVRGRRIEESTGTRDRKRAEEFRARREAELLDEAIHGRAAVATFAHAAASYLEFGGEARFMTPLIRHFGKTLLVKIDQAAIDACAKALYPHGKTSTLTRHVYTPVSAVLTHAASRGMCEFRKVERPKQPKGKTRWMTVEEASRLVEACGDHLRPIVILMLYTGARVSEALYLDWAQVDLQRGHVIYLDTKNGDDRGVPLHPAAIAALANLKHRKGAVFRRPDGEPYAPRDGEGGQIKKAFAIAAVKAGLGARERGPDGRWIYRANVTPHTCRHTWATWHYAQHRDLLALMQLGGWKQISMVQRYAHVNAANLAPSIAALPSLGEFRGSVPGMIENRKKDQRYG